MVLIPPSYARIDKLIEDGKALEAFQSARLLPDAMETWAGLGEVLAHKALDHGMAETAYELVAKGYAGTIGIRDLLGWAADVEDQDAMEFLANKATGPMLREAASRARESNGGKSAVSDLAILLGHDRDVSAWEASSAVGLCQSWQRRPRLEYERCCDRLGVPMWSSSCAAPLAALRVDFGGPWLPQWSKRAFHGLGLVEESTMWGGYEFGFWRAQIDKHPSLPWAQGVFDDLEASHYAVAKRLSTTRRLILTAKKEKSSSVLVEEAKNLARAGAGRWVPFLLAFSDELPFEESDNLSLFHLIQACEIDKFNAGMIAACWHEQSQHPTKELRQPKLARVALAAIGSGRASDEALEILAARAADLLADHVAWLNIGSNISEDLTICCRKIIACHAASCKKRKEAQNAALVKAP